MKYNLLLIYLTGTAIATSAVRDLPFTKDEASKFGCGKVCQENIAAGIKGDGDYWSKALPFDTDFYATATNFTSSSKPGDLLKLETYGRKVQHLTVPPGTTLFRMQYVSVGFNNTRVPATGFIALPFAFPAGGRKIPLLGFAHGSIGFFPGCAPSSAYTLYDYTTWTITQLAGFATVATDYAGLGNNYTRHAWNSPSINSNDVYYSILAAKTAFPNLFTHEWAAYGHSQGGAAAWALTENEALAKAPHGFLGSVAISPSVHIYDLIKAALHVPPIDRVAAPAYAPFLLDGVRAAFPDYPGTIVTRAMLQRTRLARKLQLCFDPVTMVGLDLGFAGAYNVTDLKHDATFAAWQQEYGAATGKKSHAPLLVVQSTGDRSVSSNVTVEAYKRTCKDGNAVQLSLYSSLDHSATPSGTSPEWVRWLKERFDGVKTEAKCAVTTHKAIDPRAAYLPLDF